MRHPLRSMAWTLALGAGLMAGSLDCGKHRHATAPADTVYGTLEVNSTPPGATILVDGLDSGAITPDDFTLSAGMHHVAVTLAGHTFVPASTTLAVPREGTVAYTFVEFAPRLEPDTTAHDFLQQDLATTSASWCFSVANNGNAAADSGAFVLAGPDAAQYSIVSGATYHALAPGGSQQLCVAFHPASAGAKHATIRIGASTVTLAGTGYKVPCNLAPGETSHDFGPQDAGQGYPSWCFTITNRDAAPCTDTLRLTGADPGQFAIVSGGAFDLAPGASQQVCVAFRPNAAASAGATIAVGTTAVTLTGTGVGSCQIAAPATPDGTSFGNVCTDDHPTRRLVVGNSGNLACTVAAAGCADLAVSPASATVPAGGSATFTVTFRPSGPGASPSCTVTLSDGTTQWPTTFSGTGISPPLADFTPTGGVAAHAGTGLRFVPQIQTNGSPITAYSWDFGDGGSSAAAQPTHVYSSGGSYTVTLQVTNACGTSPPAGHTVCIDEPAYVLLYHIDQSNVPDFSTNISGWGTSVPLVLYRGTNAAYGSLPVILCGNILSGEIISTGHSDSGQNIGGSETLGIPGQSFATANLPLSGAETTVSIDLTVAAPSPARSMPTVFVKVGACNHINLGTICCDEIPIGCEDRLTTTHCSLPGGDGRIEWGLEPQTIAKWMLVSGVKLTFDDWYVCPNGGPQTGAVRVVPAGQP